MVWGQQAGGMCGAVGFPTDRSLKIAEDSYRLAYMTTSNVNSFCSHTDHEVMTCNCGEDEADKSVWVWSTKEDGGQAGSIVLGPERRQVSFNPEYSSGTAAVRGNKILPSGYHHYWELKMTSAVYGTNMMLGVCTPNFDLKHGIHRFCSLLGRDEESWGYSYRGTTQHAGKYSRYGPRWGKGAIVGIHLDTWRGTMEYFLNREPLGIAFTGLQNKELYPIITSTSAYSGMKLVTSHMFPYSLQFLSSAVLYKRLANKTDASPEDLDIPPGLQSLIRKNYWPFIKYVNMKCGENRYDYIYSQNSKRKLDDDSEESESSKKFCRHLYRMQAPDLITSDAICEGSPRGEIRPSDSPRLDFASSSR